jgi:putative transposase
MRFGYRRVHVLLRREGWAINPKRTYRIYKELGMQLRNKTPRRRVKAKLREDRVEAIRPNDVWAMDFIHDQLATGRKIRVLTVVDTFSRYSPVLDAKFSYRGEDVVATLERVCSRIGYPKTIRVDQGSEFISRDMDLDTSLYSSSLELGARAGFSREPVKRAHAVSMASIRYRSRWRGLES